MGRIDWLGLGGLSGWDGLIGWVDWEGLVGWLRGMIGVGIRGELDGVDCIDWVDLVGLIWADLIG